MRLTIPLYIETQTPKNEALAWYMVRPLFFPTPLVREQSLSRAMNHFTQQLTRALEELGAQPRHDSLADFTFCPKVAQQRLQLRLHLRRSHADCRFLFVTFERFQRRVAFTPSVPDLWFDIHRGETMAHRATEVLTEYFRQQEKEYGEDFVPPQQLGLAGTAWVTKVQLDVGIRQVPFTVVQKVRFAALGDGEVMNGSEELRRVGRCLNWLYPGELERVRYRDRELAELERLLTAPDRRPVVVLGPRLVGKTALVHEYVYQATAKRRTPYSHRENVWLLAPQRLVSGMSFVGQWENRLLAILKEARRQDLVLYFDDFLGLFQAGISRDADLSMAQVLKTYVEQRHCRFLTEMTSEAWRVLRERDRGWADLFHVIPLAEPNTRENLSIQLGVVHALEARHHCQFGLEALPTVLDLQRRHARDLAFPGKSAVVLRQLAVQNQRMEITRGKVLEEFRARTGLSLEYLDPLMKLPREEVLAALQARVIGQAHALEAMADVVSIAKARLNDTSRPLASLLFLGPTGVGKTECAKALATFLFGDVDRLVRFDMNEFVVPGSAARLVGDYTQPDGLLTSALRRQPFAVVLLDEIEKAHPEIFDLLLQVLGEGRLTDALGRTVDFTNAIVVMTSNLGARAAAGSLGLRRGLDEVDAIYTRAAEKFFRPEFFNRLDRVVPFSPLNQEDIRQIARLVIRDVFQREGLARRRTILFVEEATLDHVVAHAFSPSMGARALKRGIERQLTQPAAAQLAGLRVDVLHVINLYPGPQGIALHVQTLDDAPRARQCPATCDLTRPAPVLEAIVAVSRRLEAAIAPFRPAGAIDPHHMDSDDHFYFLMHDLLQRIRGDSRDFLEQMEERVFDSLPPPRSTRSHVFSFRKIIYNTGKSSWLSALVAESEIRDYLREVVHRSQPLSESATNIQALLGNVGLATAMVEARARQAPEQILLYVRPLDESGVEAAHRLARAYQIALADEFYLDARIVDGASWPTVLLRGPHGVLLAERERGTHLVQMPHAGLTPLQIGTIPLVGDESPVATLERHQSTRHAWLGALVEGKATVADDPFPFWPVTRIEDVGGPLLDVRSNQVAVANVDNFPLALRASMRSILPLPMELHPFDLSSAPEKNGE